MRFSGVVYPLPKSRELIPDMSEHPPHRVLGTCAPTVGRSRTFARRHFWSVDELIGVVHSVVLRRTDARAELQPGLFPEFLRSTIGASSPRPQVIGEYPELVFRHLHIHIRPCNVFNRMRSAAPVQSCQDQDT
jgi:hypothetical protein